MDSNYSRSCLCGKIRYEFAKFKTNPSHCHCSICRKFHGATYGMDGWGKRVLQCLLIKFVLQKNDPEQIH
ncbi:hypothetical protein [Leptospira ilyithenensis]|uniref:GFA family protein n=1 Tax=Leptospira ilyithenensis TaxID=2484901 RepID=UPI0014386B38|nr:hypothetical protein [Leptospira ilyithenensis]